MRKIFENNHELEKVNRDLDLVSIRWDRRQKETRDFGGNLVPLFIYSLGFESAIRRLSHKLNILHTQRQVLSNDLKSNTPKDFQREQIFESVCREYERLTRKYDEFVWLTREIKVELDYEAEIQNEQKIPESLINLKRKIQGLKTELIELNENLWKLEESLLLDETQQDLGRKENELNETHKRHFEKTFRLFLLSRRLKRNMYEERSHDLNSDSD